MKNRSLEMEILDDASMPYSDLKASLDFMGIINRFFGGTAAVLAFFERAKTQKEFTVLDLGTGSGDIPKAIDAWASRAGKKAHVTAVDLNPLCLRYAKEHHGSPNVKYLCSSAFDLPHLGAFDYIVSSMFFHHLSDADIVRLLGLIATSSRRGFLINDLYRGHFAHTAALASAALSGNKTVVNDAELSVRRGFKEADFEKYKTLANLRGAEIRRVPWFRITLECQLECLETAPTQNVAVS